MEYSYFLPVLLAMLTAAIVSIYGIPVIISVARLKGLIDLPNDARKIHRNKIPTLGGLAIVSGVLIGYSIWVGNSIPIYFPYLIAAIVILFFVGIKDDILVVAPSKKFIAQVVASAIVVIGGRMWLTDFDGFLGVHTAAPNYLAIASSIFAFVIIINAYNLIDGIDGLAGSLTLVSALCFGTWFFVNGFLHEAILSATLIGAVIGFLIYNASPAKIFMGDTGSLTIGLIMSVLAFQMMALNPSASVIPLQTPTVFAFSLMIIPMFDTLRVIILRLSHKRPPFSADSRHMHHCLIRFGYKHSGICLVLGLTGFAIMTTSYFINHLEFHLYLAIILLMAFLILPISWLIKRFQKKYQDKEIDSLIDRDVFMHDIVNTCIKGVSNGFDSEELQKVNPPAYKARPKKSEP